MSRFAFGLLDDGDRGSLEAAIADHPMAKRLAQQGKPPFAVIGALPVWTLKTKLAREATWEDFPRSRTDWHLLTHRAGKPAAIIHVSRHPADHRWQLQGNFVSSGAMRHVERLDQQLNRLRERYPEAHDVWLLDAPAYHLQALCYRPDRDSEVRVVPVRLRRRHRGVLNVHQEYDGTEFLDHMRRMAPAMGFIDPPFRKLPMGARLHRNGWGLLTLVLVFAVVVCSIVCLYSDRTLLAEKPPGVNIASQWAVIEVVIFVAFMGAGWLAARRFGGILIDERNRISLGRFQWLLWASIIFGSYIVFASWNLANGTGMPSLPPDLLKLLTLVSASPIVGSVILNSKTASPSPGPAPPAVGALPVASPPPGMPDNIGLVDRNVTTAEASWADLFLGEEVANRNVVDVGRLQQLFFTVFIATIYLEQIWADLSHIAYVDAHRHSIPLGITIPHGDWLWLLGISHGAYLAQKAAPKPNSGTNN